MRTACKLFAASIGIFLFVHVDAQTIFTYGDKNVSKAEFEKAFNKNPDTTGSHAEKVAQYLNLYINFKLKLQAAYDEKLNTNEDLKAEAANFKEQLTDNYINQQANLAQLVHEAFERSKTDIQVQQVFVEPGNDTAAAFNTINQAYADLKNGKSFDEVAEKYSTDSATKATKGLIGYITVFTLPYEIESIIYNTPVGSYSNIYRSTIGYHIFKVIHQRPASGRRKVEQLMFVTPDFFTKQQVDEQKVKADSVHNLIEKGTAFSALLPTYYPNYSNFQDANDIEVSVGQYDADFEQAVFALKQPGDVSKPFKTTYGYNIIKLIQDEPAATSEDDVVNMAYLQTKVQNDNRLAIAKNKLIAKWLSQTGFKQHDYNTTNLWAYTDSGINVVNNLPATYKGIQPSQVLFEFTKQKITVANWVDYVRSNQNTGTENIPYEKLMSDFKNSSCVTYYRNNIEDFYPAAEDQLKEFSDANMLFAIMDKHVWNKAAVDTAGLEKYYAAHKEKYTWQPGVTALVVSGNDESLLKEVAEKVKAKPSTWKDIIAAYNNASLNADSNRFEKDQLPVKTVVMQKDFQSNVEKNEQGDGYLFIHVYEVFNNTSSRNFEDARGMVMNDYQEQLEQQWITDLKKKYPVKVNDDVVKTAK